MLEHDEVLKNMLRRLRTSEPEIVHGA
jgi:hypothetical protein